MKTQRAALLIGGIAFLGACSQDEGPLAPGGPLAPATALFDFSPDPCTFTVTDMKWTLDADCSTSSSIVIPDGFTLDGAHHTITAVDPIAGTFVGAVVRNGGAVAHVTFLEVSAQGLANACKGADDRLRGIMFDGASGTISHSRVVGINKGASGCQEGNAIEIRNAPFDGNHPATQTVEIAHNSIFDYQKTGIVCNGDVLCDIHHNTIGSSATQANLAANSIQIGFAGGGSITLNDISGNQWCGPSAFFASAILLFEPATGVLVQLNRIDGNSDIGIYTDGTDAMIDRNTVADIGDDCNQSGFDWGIGDFGPNYPAASNDVTKNKVSGFDIPYDPDAAGGKNQVKKPQGSPG